MIDPNGYVWLNWLVYETINCLIKPAEKYQSMSSANYTL
jgi:hypothetical protein